jgi:dTMP kinase
VLVTIEGIDGAGKTTLAAALARELGAVLLREPGGVALAERVRDVAKDPALRVDARAEALLFAAARAQLVAERLEPLLRDGATVVLDRFVDSSLAYQGAGRGVGVEAVAALNAFATGDVVPARTLLLRVAPDVALARLGARGAAPDRLEGAGTTFFGRVAEAYDALAAADPDRWRVLDGAAAPEAVLAAALEAVGDAGTVP